ncbi:hypothetical protein NL676_002292 [Syzygium grande]|nr:hypothetical protein NL676_002292 [Syzygium grande]
MPRLYMPETQQDQRKRSKRLARRPKTKESITAIELPLRHRRDGRFLSWLHRAPPRTGFTNMKIYSNARPDLGARAALAAVDRGRPAPRSGHEGPPSPPSTEGGPRPDQ